MLIGQRDVKARKYSSVKGKRRKESLHWSKRDEDYRVECSNWSKRNREKRVLFGQREMETR